MNKTKIIELLELCMEINEETKHDVFFSYSPHVKWIDVSYYLNGWEKYKDATLFQRIDVNSKDNYFNMAMDRLKEELL